MESYQILENEFADFIGVENTVAVSSGTSALHVAFEALRFSKGSTVLVPEFSMIACPRAVSLAGLIPEGVDCNPVTLNIGLQNLPHHPRVAHVNGIVALLVVHTYGRIVPDNVFDWAHSHSVAVIEDMSEAHGVIPDPRTVATCWSFYKNKIIAGEEGGMIAFKYKGDADDARQLRSLGFTEAHDFNHRPGGINARMSNAHASLILDSLHNYKLNLQKRNTLQEYYVKHAPPGWHQYRRCPWVFDMRIPQDVNLSNTQIVKGLSKFNARLGFKPISSQLEYFNPGYSLLNADTASREVFYLPLDPSLTENDVKQACYALADIRSQ